MQRSRRSCSAGPKESRTTGQSSPKALFMLFIVFWTTFLLLPKAEDQDDVPLMAFSNMVSGAVFELNTFQNILDRSIGTSTPMSTYRAGEMHHTLRYGKKGSIKVIVYGDINDNEKATWKLMIERNRINQGYRDKELVFLNSVSDLEVSKL